MRPGPGPAPGRPRGSDGRSPRAVRRRVDRNDPEWLPACVPYPWLDGSPVAIAGCHACDVRDVKGGSDVRRTAVGFTIRGGLMPHFDGSSVTRSIEA